MKLIIWVEGIRKAKNDVCASLNFFHVCLHLVLFENKQRYIKSILGPFWVTLSALIMLGCMGPLYSILFHQPLGVYWRYISISYVLWILISGTIVDSCNTFIANEGYIKSIKIPFTFYLLKHLLKHLINFLHIAPLPIIVILFVPIDFNLRIWFLLLGAMLLAVNLIWISLVFSIVSLRYRDFPMIVSSLFQISLFITPIFWLKESIGNMAYIENYNPLYILIDIVRSPILGEVNLITFKYAFFMSLIGPIFAFFLFSSTRKRIAYWL